MSWIFVKKSCVISIWYCNDNALFIFIYVASLHLFEEKAARIFKYLLYEFISA